MYFIPSEIGVLVKSDVVATGKSSMSISLLIGNVHAGEIFLTRNVHIFTVNQTIKNIKISKDFNIHKKYLINTYKYSLLIVTYSASAGTNRKIFKKCFFIPPERGTLIKSDVLVKSSLSIASFTSNELIIGNVLVVSCMSFLIKKIYTFTVN